MNPFKDLQTLYRQTLLSVISKNPKINRHQWIKKYPFRDIFIQLSVIGIGRKNVTAFGGFNG